MNRALRMTLDAGTFASLPSEVQEASIDQLINFLKKKKDGPICDGLRVL